ncbi:HAD-IA family hydrolase [Streptomyces sp. DSM 42041]|uniref:HAD-IA family hydrolase n=1 Tax=Streptomyces hazeniae TaxID=3075538 RepID=A0ABU2NZH6_9ACTN|nr:HAD-IA family hydrolase [Streptomyces sp. DSM 42041]MDT0382159.1 HAD-IA family hydrolase [Streptomyces sp. DSM 42041]
MPALIFDCDGVLIDTEQGGHLRAFNEMWREFGVPWQWSPAQYAAKLKISGGKERLRSLRHDVDFRTVWDVPTSPSAWEQTVAAWHRRKTEIFLDIVRSGGVTPRPGVRRLAEEAAKAGWSLAIASASAQRSVQAVLKHVMGNELACRFTVLSGESVAAKKPAPDVYELAARAIDAKPSDCVVVEDSRNGLVAALAAGMTCVVTPTELSRSEDFSGAALVITCLGEPAAEQGSVLANPHGVPVADHVDLGHLRQLLQTAQMYRTALHPLPHSNRPPTDTSRRAPSAVRTTDS